MSEQDPADGSGDDKPKKRKIDLKSRLSNVRASGSMAAVPRTGSEDPLAFPPPPRGSVPPPKMLSSGGAAAYKPPISSAFAAPEPEVKPTVQQQTIQVSDAEVQEERKAGSKKARNAAIIMFFLALPLGGAVGLLYERGSAGRAAVKSAGDLSKDIKAALDTMKDFSDQLRKGGEQLQAESYPDDLVAFVQKNKIAFSAENFRGRSVGGLPPEQLRALIKFTQGVEELNGKIDRLGNVLNSKNTKDAVQKIWAQKKDPVINYSILLDKRGDDYFALLVPNKPPLPAKGTPPAKYTVTKPPQGEQKEAKDFEGKRYTAATKGEDAHTALIPLEERTIAGLTAQQVVAQLVVGIGDNLSALEGKKDPTNPDAETRGLIKDGEQILQDLGHISK